MKLSDQVCTLEQAARLKELGVLQSSLFWWTFGGEKPAILYEDRVSQSTYLWIYCTQKPISAFTVAELGQMLPESFDLEDGHNWSWYHRHNWKGHSVGYSAYGAKPIEQVWYKTEVESKGDMLIYLLEKNIINAEEANRGLRHE